MNKYFETTDPTLVPDEISSEQGHDYELTTKDDKYTIMLSAIFKGRFTSEIVETFGEKYEDNMIGKTIQYTSGTNNVTDWIILGKQVNEQGKNDIIITTKIPVSTLYLERTFAEYSVCDTKIENACKSYVGNTGILGTKNAEIKEIRSITINDINTAVGFNETVDIGPVEFKYPYWPDGKWIDDWSEIDSSFIFPLGTYGYYYYEGDYKLSGTMNNWRPTSITLGKPNNMKYIEANGESYWFPGRGSYLTDDGVRFRSFLC